MVWLGYSYCLGATLSFQSHTYFTQTNMNVFVRISNGSWQNGGHVSGFQLAGLPDHRSHFKSGPFETQPLFDHSKFRLVWISDPNCICSYQCHIPTTVVLETSRIALYSLARIIAPEGRSQSFQDRKEFLINAIWKIWNFLYLQSGSEKWTSRITVKLKYWTSTSPLFRSTN